MSYSIIILDPKGYVCSGLNLIIGFVRYMVRLINIFSLNFNYYVILVHVLIENKPYGLYHRSVS